jgi:hypothetical protein
VRKFHELQGENIQMKGFVESPIPPRKIDLFVHKILGLQHSLPKGTRFDFTLNADSYYENWTRKYPTGKMFGVLYADYLEEAGSSYIGADRERTSNKNFGKRCLVERMFGGLVHLYHIPRVDPKTGFIHLDTRKVTAFWNLISLPPFMAPSVKAIEGVCPETGRFQFDVESIQPAPLLTRICYKGTICVDDDEMLKEKEKK